jgi:hypothetical protein
MENSTGEWHILEERRPAMTYKWFTSRFMRRRQEIDIAENFIRREPQDHPEVARMTMRELADLPMPAYTLDACPCDARVN